MHYISPSHASTAHNLATPRTFLSVCLSVSVSVCLSVCLSSHAPFCNNHLSASEHVSSQKRRKNIYIKYSIQHPYSFVLACAGHMSSLQQIIQAYHDVCFKETGQISLSVQATGTRYHRTENICLSCLQVGAAVCVVGKDLSLTGTAIGSAFLKKCPSLAQVGSELECWHKLVKGLGTVTHFSCTNLVTWQ